MQPIAEERRRGERRGRILRAASRIFSRRPFGLASMDEIAHEAGVGKPTLYRYFDGKDDLFAAVFSDVLDAVEERLDQALAAESGAEARLTALAAAIVPVFRDHLVSGRLVDGDAAADLSRRRVFRERQARIADRLATAIADGTRRGTFRAVAPDRVARLMLGAIWSGAAEAGDAPDREVARDVVDLVLRGLSADPSPARPHPVRREPVREVIA